MTWFGSLDLAYKYAIVFGSLLLLTILAGFIKVLYSRQKLKKFSKEKSNVEEGQKDDQMELNQREKDEGDLFGIRAIEAGFYAGIPQSRPTSAAGSYMESPSMSSNTLVGKLNSDKGNSMASSVTSLPLAHVNGNGDSEARSNSPPRRKTPPTIRLAPSEAELNGRINHNAAVNMGLNVPPSPILGHGPRSPTFGGSDSGESDGQASPRSLSPRDAHFRPDHYAPQPPQIPMPHGLRPFVHSAEDTAISQSASFNEPSPGSSPEHSAPPSPGHPPTAKLPSIPARALREAQSNPEPERPSSPVRLLPQTYQPAHQRVISDSSSVYGDQNRASMHRASSSMESAYNFSFPGNSNRNSVTQQSMKEQGRRPSASSSFLAPESTTSSQTAEPRLSEFYDAYYRHSQLGVATSTDAPRRPNMLNLTQPTIVEVPSPQPSPNPRTSVHQPGVAW